MARLLMFASLLAAAFASPWQLREDLEVAPLARRDSPDAPGIAVANALYNISNQTALLNYAIGNFSVDYNSLTALSVHTFEVLDAIEQGIATTNSGGNLSTTDAILLTGIIVDLTKAVNTSISSLINIKQELGGIAPVVLANMKQQQSATISFAAAVAAKLPSYLLGQAEAANQPILNSFTSGIAVFSTPNVNKDKSVYTSDGTIGVGIKHVAIMISVVLGGMLAGTGLIF